MARKKSNGKAPRVRDPVHDLIRFDPDDEVDMLAYKLIDTRAFQRLRRIKQLGFSDYVYPGATHTRFAHSLGVFATARDLVRLMRAKKWRRFSKRRAKVSVLAALLHDIGHGPFSHAFETVQKARGIKKRHEQWSHDIILSPSSEAGIRAILDKEDSTLAQEIADLIVAVEPADPFDAIVSSSFDADRLDYIRRDRLMSGTGTGAIDFAWLMDNVRIDSIPGANGLVETFTLGPKAIQQAEIFLLARFHLYEQVYFHKTNRGMEMLLTACLAQIAEHCGSRMEWKVLGLPVENLLVQYLRDPDPSVASYLWLDDYVVTAALAQVAASAEPAGHRARDLAMAILNRRKPYCLDLAKLANDHPHLRERYFDVVEVARAFVRDNKLEAKAFFDEPKITVYGKSKQGTQKHKRLWISSDAGAPREITEASAVIKGFEERPLGRMFFLHEDDRKRARAAILRTFGQRRARRRVAG